jgi:lysophospholipase L1-like esterase
LRKVVLIGATMILETILLVGGTSLTGAATTALVSSPHKEFYLALGDSAPIWNGDKSYSNLIAGHFRTSVPHLKLVKMACSDETSSSMLSGSTCAPGGSQENEAVAFLQRHEGSVALVTIDIGGNDIVFCAGPNGLNVACVQRAETTVQTNLATILNALRSAAGSTTQIVGMTYYDPLLGDWLAGGSVRQVALDTVPILVQFNSLLATSYTQFGDPVADVQGAFASTDLTDQVASPWGNVPVAVDRACIHLDIRCHTNRVERFGDDPNRSGAEVIAAAFEAAIGFL